jgi:tRNA(Ile)-lysidine synthase
MSLLQRFQEFIKENAFFQPKDKLLLAVSGGVDSVVLCELCKQSGYDFAIAHCNFQLRGEESERDEQFVRNLGDKYEVDVFVKKFDTKKYAEETRKGIQEAARNLRYEWFEELRQGKSFSFTLLAHHANDNIETVLMNFVRGTGLEGLTGISVFTVFGYCIRPMLSFTRSEIEEFARENNLAWVEDSSNVSSRYTRNFFRNEIIPSIKKAYPQAEENILDNIQRFKKISNLYGVLVEELKGRLCKYNQAEVRIPVKELMHYQGTSFIYEIIKDYYFGEKQVDEVIKLATAESGKYIENDMYQIIKHRNWFIIAPRFVRTDTIIIEKDSNQIRSHAGVLDLKFINKEKFVLDKSEKVAQFDAKHIEFPLLLRKWKQGDYFYPLGMRKKKKLARFFIDQKLAKNQKENVWVIESAKRIIWVVGLRIDDRFKVTERTKQILQLTISSP